MQSRTPRAHKKARTSISIAPRLLPPFEDLSTDPAVFLSWLMTNWPMVDTRFADLGHIYADLSNGLFYTAVDMEVLTALVALIWAELGDKSQDIQDLDVWTAIQNI